MVSTDLGRRLAEQLAELTHGQLNSVESTELGAKVNNDTTFFGAAKRAIASSSRSDVIKSLGHPIKAVVLYAWKEKVELHGGEIVEKLHVKARIPELDIVPLPRALPIDNNPGDEDADWGTINLHTTFVSQESVLKVPKPGDIVGVDFGNREQLYDPIYYKIISRNIAAPGSPSPKKAFANKPSAERNTITELKK